MIRMRYGLTVAALMALGACHHETKSDDQRTAGGQVLKGSVSDAMIPYETLHSQPPLAKGGAGPMAADSADSSADSKAAPADAPAGGDAGQTG